MSLRERLVKTGTVGAVAVLVVAPLLDRVVFPEPDPPSSAYPAVGQMFHSETEGFTQRVLRIDDVYIWSELILHPHAPGPPAHVHTTFAERFIVAEGEVSMVVDGETHVLRAGEELLVEPGVAHQPFNATGTEAIVRGPLTPDYALPRDFAVFLTQAYGFFDESPANNRPPRALLQMSRFSPRYDSWLGGPPVFAQRATYWVLGPIARLMGYRSYYERYSPQPPRSDDDIESLPPHDSVLRSNPATDQPRVRKGSDRRVPGSRDRCPVSAELGLSGHSKAG